MSWSGICQPVSEGGLGLKDFIQWNKSQILMHLWNVISRKNSLWASWVSNTIPVQKNFWSIKIPKDCSWIWRKVLKLRSDAKNFICYKIGNGQSISLWLDPWWNGQCLADNIHDPIIQNANSNANEKVHSLISSGFWNLPSSNYPDIYDWAHHFNYPHFDLSKTDLITWEGTNKVNTRIIWDHIRHKRDDVIWHHAVWFKHGILRYTYANWLLCNNMMYTMDRLANFGIIDSHHCLLCVGGNETAHHLFQACTYAQFILQNLFQQNLRITMDFDLSWYDFLIKLLHIHSQKKRYVALLTAQFFFIIFGEREMLECTMVKYLPP